jgi:hypothetical protein
MLFIANLFLFSTKVFLIAMKDGSLVTRVGLDMIWKYIDGLWTVFCSKCAMLCFTWLTCVFGGFSVIIVLFYIELLGVVIHDW